MWGLGLERLLVKYFPKKLTRTVGFAYGLTKRRTSYSQFGEDLVLMEYFKRKGIQKGVYFDIGCFHPVWISNTHLLHRHGWTGYCVDIDKFKLDAMKFARRGRVETFLGAVVPETDGEETITVYKFNRMWSEIDTTDKEAADKYNYSYYEKTVPKIGIKDLISRAETINLLNIDVEGIDSDIICNLDFDKTRPEAIVFEDTENWGGRKVVTDKLRENGYVPLFVSGGSVGYALP